VNHSRPGHHQTGDEQPGEYEHCSWDRWRWPDAVNPVTIAARLALDRFAPAAVAALTAVMGGGLIVRGADGLLG
jgi:hypothetical protein